MLSLIKARILLYWLILFIDSGYIHPHVGNFPYHKDGSDLLVVNKTNSDQIVFYTKSVKVFGYPLQKYYVVSRQ